MRLIIKYMNDTTAIPKAHEAFQGYHHYIMHKLRE